MMGLHSCERVIIFIFLGFSLSEKLVSGQANYSYLGSVDLCTSGLFSYAVDCDCPCSEVFDCPDNQIFNCSSCLCTCRPELVAACMPPMEFDFGTCQCQCPNAVNCTFPMRINETTCVCECPDAGADCTDNGMVLDPDTCECACPEFDPPCLLPKIINPDSCQCQCPNKFCSEGQEQNDDTCECECSKCPLGKEPLENCTCECFPVDCDPGKQQNPYTCECECPPFQCASDERVDLETCQCIPCDCDDSTRSRRRAPRNSYSGSETLSSRAKNTHTSHLETTPRRKPRPHEHHPMDIDTKPTRSQSKTHKHSRPQKSDTQPETKTWSKPGTHASTQRSKTEPEMKTWSKPGTHTSIRRSSASLQAKTPRQDAYSRDSTKRDTDSMHDSSQSTKRDTSGSGCACGGNR